MELIPMHSVDETILEMMTGILVRDQDGWERIETIIQILKERDEARTRQPWLQVLQ